MLWKKMHFALHFIASAFFSFPYCQDYNRDVITAPIKPRPALIMKPLFIFQYNKHLSRFEIPLLKMVYYYLLSLGFYIQTFFQVFPNRRTDGSIVQLKCDGTRWSTSSGPAASLVCYWSVDQVSGRVSIVEALKGPFYQWDRERGSKIELPLRLNDRYQGWFLDGCADRGRWVVTRSGWLNGGRGCEVMWVSPHTSYQR